MGWEAVRLDSPSPPHRDLGLIAYGRGEPSLEWFSWRMSADGTVHSQDNPESDHQNIGTAPSDFLSHFCHLEENSVPSYLFKECSRPYLIAITSSSHNILATSLAGSALHKLIKVLIGMFCS